MLNEFQTQALHDQVITAYYDQSEESYELLEQLSETAMNEMNTRDWNALCTELGVPVSEA
jgi:hypothetical protein